MLTSISQGKHFGAESERDRTSTDSIEECEDNNCKTSNQALLDFLGPNDTEKATDRQKGEEHSAERD